MSLPGQIAHITVIELNFPINPSIPVGNKLGYKRFFPRLGNSL